MNYDPLGLRDKQLKNGYVFRECVGEGNNSFVYKVTSIEFNHSLACKLLKPEKLKPEWKTEVRKTVELPAIQQIIPFHSCGTEEINGKEYNWILSEFIEGENLRTYASNHKEEIDLPFIQDILEQILILFVSLHAIQSTHGDLHEGNIMITKPDYRVYRSSPIIKVGDFGIGNSLNGLTPKDDYKQLALVIGSLLDKFVDPAQLSGAERYIYGCLRDDFLPKRLLEKDPTSSIPVNSPDLLLEDLATIKKISRRPIRSGKLKNPFDYLNCEQIGNSFELLQKLYAQNFPGYEELLQKSNTILTGPRGCGKTTIFKNLSLKTQLLASKTDLRSLSEYVGIYYYCTDLFFAFPYLSDRPIKDETKKTIVHYFNLAILYEILDTLDVAQNTPEGTLTEDCLLQLQGFLKERIPNYSFSTKTANALRHMMDFALTEKTRIKITDNKKAAIKGQWLTLDFLSDLVEKLQDVVPWMRERPLYFFLDDYSMPKIPKPMQGAINDIIMERYSNCFFKVSTESVNTFHHRDSRDKQLDEAREFDTIDLGAYFLEADSKVKQSFLAEIINNRFENTQTIPAVHNPIELIIGPTDYDYGQLAYRIRLGKETVKYYGWSMVCDLCSGDIAKILQIVRDMLTSQGNDVFTKDKSLLPIPRPEQDRAIRQNANDFLISIESAPNTGPRLRAVAEAFGNTARHYLLTRDSKNEDKNPPMQAFRLEILDKPDLNTEQSKIYNDLIRYAVFLRDERGKSQRGAVVPRLYLRRLLLPTFLLTPNKRDSIRITPAIFNLLLDKPDKFQRWMKGKGSKDQGQRARKRLESPSDSKSQAKLR